MQIKVINNSGYDLPAKATPGAAAMDLRAAHDATLSPGKPVLIKTGLFVALEPGYEAWITPRSGLALKHAVTVLNAPGLIDSDYRGEIGVILMNGGHNPYYVKAGDRIAQMTGRRSTDIDWWPVDELPVSARGSGGFGSTGA